MALVICDAGEIHLLAIMLKTALDVDEPFTLHLFKNDMSPSSTTAVDDYQECDFAGYTSITLTRANWGTPTTISGAASSTYGTDALTWTCTGSGNTVYGTFVLDGSGNAVWGERFSAPRVLANGDVLNYTPVFTFDSAN